MNRPEINYFILPWYRKLYYNTIDKTKMFLKNITKINYRFLAIFGMIMAVVITLVVIMLMSKSEFQLRPAYDKTDYVNISSIDTSETLILSNDQYQFNFDPATTMFNVEDKVTNNIWYSNPQSAHASAVEVNELYYVYYSSSLELPKKLSVRSKSIVNEDYELRIKDDSIEVLYTIGRPTGITINDIPIWINKTTYEEQIKPVLLELQASDDRTERVNAGYVISSYTEVNGEDAYFCSLNSTTAQDSLEILYNIIFGDCGYTQEQFADDQEAHGVEVTTTPIFEFAVKYSLSDVGLDVELINESISETEEYPLTYIDILPYFGSASMDDSGYILIPDGSGMLIDYNSQKYTSTYSKRIYGIDQSVNQYAEALNNADYDGLSVPMYGVNTNGVGFINVVTSSSTMTTLNAGFNQATSSGDLIYKYPNASYRFYNREYDYSYFGSGSSAIPIYIWTDTYNTENFKSSYIFSQSKDEYDYVEMANDYSDYLVSTGILTDKVDNTTSPVMNISLLGGYVYNDSFFGLPYERVGSLTNVKQVKEIADMFLDADITNLNLGYQGWSNNGIKPTYSGKITYNSSIGKKNDFIELNEYLTSKNVNLVLETYMNNAFSDENLKDGQISQTIYGADVYRTPQEYSSDLWYIDGLYSSQFTLSSTNYMNLAQDLKKTYNSLGLSSIGFMDFSGELNSSLDKDDTVLRTESLKYYEDAANYLSENFDYIQDRNPNIYGIKYLTNILDLPVVADNLNIMTSSVPFIQLVLNGYVDYSAGAFNLDDTNSNLYYKLKSIETGGNINYTLSYESTIQLANTEYNYYYSTYYKNWLDEAIAMYSELDELGIYKSKIVDHEIQNLDGTIVKVTYDNGMTFEIDYSTLTMKQTGGN